ERGDLLLRIPAQARSGLELAALTVATHPDGRLVRLDQVATVREGLAEK
ncbi:MAG TPA: hypothetical protein DCS97_04205, partial [Planctomycetes bacterium]|nr:hypothetical protein [Planctomycetota bacterium]